MRASRPIPWVLGIALMAAPILAPAVAAETNPYAGAWTGSGKLEGHGTCASPFKMRFEVDADGGLRGTLELSRGSHGIAGEYRLTGTVDERGGRLTDGRASKALTIDFKGTFAEQSARGTVAFLTEASCYGDWRAQRDAPVEPDSERATPDAETAPADDSAGACGDEADTRRRLEAVDRLLKNGLISEAEASRKRQAVLACL